MESVNLNLIPLRSPKNINEAFIKTEYNIKILNHIFDIYSKTLKDIGNSIKVAFSIKKDL